MLTYFWTQFIKNVYYIKLNQLILQLTAVAARDIKRAKSFADFHSVDQAYGSYEELAKDKNVG